MCVVSMVGDFYNDKWAPYYFPQQKTSPYLPPDGFPYPQIPQNEIEKLRKEVEEMKELLRRAKIYDQKNNEPDCEVEDKMARLRKIAEAVGIDLDDVLSKQKKN